MQKKCYEIIKSTISKAINSFQLLYLVIRLRSKKLGDPARLGIDNDLDLDLDDLEDALEDLLPLLELLELLRLEALDPEEE